MMTLPQQWIDTEVPVTPTQDELLDYLQKRRDSLIMELRAIDRMLMQHDRIQRETLPRRAR